VCTQHIVDPTYSRLTWFARITGTVNVDVEVAANGSVRSAVGSGAHNLLNHAAEENVKKWTFCSEKDNFKVKMSYVYRFEGQEEDEPLPKVVFHLPRVEIVAHPPIINF
jgi:TonB family protein